MNASEKIIVARKLAKKELNQSQVSEYLDTLRWARACGRGYEVKNVFGGIVRHPIGTVGNRVAF